MKFGESYEQSVADGTKGLMTTEFREDLTLEEIIVGRDTLMIIKGGEAHIGTVSTAYLIRKNPLLVKVETTSVPGHKEHLLSERFARHCAEQLHRSVTVVMGIHFDGLSMEEINTIVTITENMVDSFLAGKMSDSVE